MSVLNRIVTLLLVAGSFFSGSAQQLLNVGGKAKVSTTIYQERAGSGGGRGSGGTAGGT